MIYRKPCDRGPRLFAPEAPPQCYDRDLTARIEPQRDITDAETAVGVADHISVSPKADAAIPAAQQVGNNRPTAGQAYLPTMRMATEIQIVSRSCGVIGHFGRMDQRDPKALGRSGQSRQSVARKEAMHIVKSGHDNMLTPSREDGRFVYQNFETQILESLGHSGGVMIAEYRQMAIFHTDCADKLGQRTREAASGARWRP